MTTMTIPKRPFASDLFTGLMLPDGIFVTMLGVQTINAQFTNGGASTVSGSVAFIESASHPGIVVTPSTHALGALAGGATRTLGWNADFSACPAGNHYVSFIVESPTAQRTRVIKKIFVVGVEFDGATRTFRAHTPEGVLSAQFADFVKPRNRCCGKRSGRRDEKREGYTITNIGKLVEAVHRQEVELCLPGYLPSEIKAVWTPTPPYAGQYGDLPFEDPWWKILLCILAFVLLIVAAIVEATSGTGEVTVTAGSPGGSPSPSGDCCGVQAQGGGTSVVAAALVAAAAAVATVAAASDARDPFRRGQDHTVPASGELTLAEHVFARFSYPEPVALGRPFAAGLEWKYERVTTGGSYTFGATDQNQNIHVLAEYSIDAPETLKRYARHPWIVRARFQGADGRPCKGGDLFVQCFLVGPNGQWRKILLQDDGNPPDEKPTDGVYTGLYDFWQREEQPGLWHYFVIAQDVNHATPDMKPEEAAQIIGGMVVTHQLVVTFDQDNCPFVPDGHVLVV